MRKLSYIATLLATIAGVWLILFQQVERGTPPPSPTNSELQWMDDQERHDAGLNSEDQDPYGIGWMDIDNGSGTG